MPNRNQSSIMQAVPAIGMLLLLAIGGALFITQVRASVSLGLAFLMLLLVLSLLNTEFGIHVILLSMLLSPEIVVGSVGGISFGKPEVKADLLVLRIEDLILTLVTLVWLARMALFKDIGLVRRTRLNAPILAYTASLVLATLFGVFFGNVRPLQGFFYTLKFVEYFVVFLITVNYVETERQANRLLATALGTCAISALMGLTQIPAGERVSAPFEGQYGEPNTFGGYLVFMLALVLGQFLTSSSVFRRLGWLGFAILVSVPILFSLSRTSWLASIPMLLTLIFFSSRRLLIMIGLGILVLLAPMLLPKSVVDRYNYTLFAKEDRGEYRVAGAKLDLSTSQRLDSWIRGYRGWQSRPFLGYGATGFAFMDAQYVRVLVETGLIGLTAFLWMLWRIGKMGLETLQRMKGSPYEGIALGYLAGFIAITAHCIGANTFVIVRIMEPFWFMTGIIAVLPTIATQQPDTSAI
jgi:hypothetical protein